MTSPEQIGPQAASSRFYILLGYAVIAIVFGGLFLWSTLAPIDGAVVASGQIVVQSKNKSVQHLEGGVIGAILVREGDRVDAGQVVARLDGTTPQANLALIDGQLAELYARRARFEAERDLAADLGEPRGVQAVLDNHRYLGKIVAQATLFAARRTTRETQKNLLQQSVVQQQERIVGLQAQMSALDARITLGEEELVNMERLHSQKLIDNSRLLELRRESSSLIGERGALQANIAEARSLIAEASLEVSRLEEEGREQAISGLGDTEVSITELEERRITAADALRRTEIRAPQSGQVLGLAVHTVGGVIGPGTALMDIVPDSDQLQVAARIEIQDIDKVFPGQAALLRFSAFGSSRSPEVDGAVRVVSADSSIDELSGAHYYQVEIDMLDGGALADELQGRTLVPGMPVEAFIKTGSKSALAYLLKPLRDSVQRSLRED